MITLGDHKGKYKEHSLHIKDTVKNSHKYKLLLDIHSVKCVLFLLVILAELKSDS